MMADMEPTGDQTNGMTNLLLEKELEIDHADDATNKPASLRSRVLSNTNLFELQITELLSELRVKRKQKNLVEKFVEQLRCDLLSLRNSKTHGLCDQEWLAKSGVRIPLVQEPPHVKGVFKFVKPVNVLVHGSFPLNLATEPNVNVDIAVEMPDACLQEKDFMNHRYHRKRALYLAYIASKMAKKTNSSYMYSYLHGNHMKPILVINPTGPLGKFCQVHVHVTIPNHYFKFSRFIPSRSNIRRNWFNACRISDTMGVLVEGDEVPTPHYNNIFLTDIVMKNHHELLLHCLSLESSQGKGKHLALRNAIMLLKVWLRRRELDQGLGCFSGFIMTMYVVYLLEQKQISLPMTVSQIVRVTLTTLAHSDWSSNGISLCKESGEYLPTMQMFHQAFDVVFVDSTGYVNLCADMYKSTFHRVRHEAKLSVEHLQNKTLDAFHLLFLKQISFSHKFDHLFILSDTDNLRTLAMGNYFERLLDFCGSYKQAILPLLVNLILEALGKRLDLLDIQLVKSPVWNITDDAPLMHLRSSTLFGLLLNIEYATSLLEKGPDANTNKATEFQSFWGEKSELRRFQDGTICEAVLWPGATIAERRCVCEAIVKHILHRHFGIQDTCVVYQSAVLDPLLKRPVNEKDVSVHTSGTGEEESMAIIHSFDDLCKMLRSLQELPLSFTSIQGISPAFRFTEVFPPTPCQSKGAAALEKNSILVPKFNKPAPPWVQPLSVILHMEGSGKWPDDAEAVKQIKIAFCLKLAELLRQHSLTVVPTARHIDVFKDGYVFRLRVAYHREKILLQQERSPDGMLRLRQTEESLRVAQETEYLPTLTTALHGLQQKHNTYSASCRLLKRWMNAQLLSHHITQEAIDLITAYVYLHPEPFTVPNSAVTGFLRILSVLSEFDWQSCAMVVNFNDKLSVTDYEAIQKNFLMSREKLPPMFIVTPYDTQSMWTKQKPSQRILSWLVTLARAAVPLLGQQLVSGTSNEAFKQMFRAPLDLYDVIIYIHHRFVPRCYQAVDIESDTYIPRLKPYTKHEREKMPVTGFDPVECYFKELESTYGDYALFFINENGGDFIAALWKPNAFYTDTDTKIPKTAGKITREKKKPASVEDVLNGFQLLGTGIVKKLECRTHHWQVK